MHEVYHSGDDEKLSIDPYLFVVLVDGNDVVLEASESARDAGATFTFSIAEAEHLAGALGDALRLAAQQAKAQTR